MFENKSYIVQQGVLVEDVIEQLNKFGQENWEVAGVLKNASNEVIFFLKRKIEPAKRKKG